MNIEKDKWLWVVVQDPGGSEMFLGQHDEKNDVSFVPAFYEKSDAETCLDLMSRDENLKYEVQAIKYGLLEQYCRENGFVVFICNSAGEVLLKPMINDQ
ncbi:hypothetical protein ACFL6W_05260 [Thermodesulfobacteriota bacterium]